MLLLPIVLVNFYKKQNTIPKLDIIGPRVITNQYCVLACLNFNSHCPIPIFFVENLFIMFILNFFIE